MAQETNPNQRNDQQAPDEHTAPPVDEQPETDPVTDPEVTPETDPETAETEQEPDSETETDDLAAAIGDGDQLKKANREAANYRHQLREAQTEIEELKAAAETGLQQAFSARASNFTKVELDAKELRQYSEQIGEVPTGDTAEIKLKHPEDFERMTGLTAHDLTYDATSVLDESRYTEELEKLFRSRPELFEGTEQQQRRLSSMKSLSDAFSSGPHNNYQNKDFKGAFRPAAN